MTKRNGTAAQPEPDDNSQQGYSVSEPSQELTREQFEAEMGGDINEMADDAEREEMPDIDDLAAEPSQGAWPKGWYKAKTIEGYKTNNGKQVETKTTESQEGDSWNVAICLVLTNSGGDERTMAARFNYRDQDLDEDVVTAVRAARETFAGVQGKWPGEAADLQRSSIALGKLSQVQKAYGFKFGMRNGKLIPGVFVGQAVDVRLTINDDGYNDVKEFAPSGERAGRSKRRSKK